MELFLSLYLYPILCKVDLKSDFFDNSKFVFPNISQTMPFREPLPMPGAYHNSEFFFGRVFKVSNSPYSDIAIGRNRLSLWKRQSNRLNDISNTTLRGKTMEAPKSPRAKA